ncbi:hypothetical protein A6U98_07780 [Rhizobium sp. WYCCWR10014]|nr:hypothetical protein A6U98_07780 [Rhizobium sp. WYCCWR10014]
MLRNLILLCAALGFNGGGALAEESVPTRMFRYAILIDQQEPIYGEVACAEYPCQLANQKLPDINLSLHRYDDDSVRPIVSCGMKHCFISYRPSNINLSQTGKLLKFNLAEGAEPGHHAVLLRSRQVGEIIISF